MKPRQLKLTRDVLSQSHNLGVREESVNNHFFCIGTKKSFFADFYRSDVAEEKIRRAADGYVTDAVRTIQLNIFGETVKLTKELVDREKLAQFLVEKYQQHYQGKKTPEEAAAEARKHIALLDSQVSQYVLGPVAHYSAFSAAATYGQEARVISATATTTIYLPQLRVVTKEGDLIVRSKEQETVELLAVIKNQSEAMFELDEYEVHEMSFRKASLALSKAEQEEKAPAASPVQAERRRQFTTAKRGELDAVRASMTSTLAPKDKALHLVEITTQGDLVPALLMQEKAPEIDYPFEGQYIAGPALRARHAAQDKIVAQENRQMREKFEQTKRSQVRRRIVLGIGLILLGIGISLIPGVGHAPGAWIVSIGVVMALGCFASAADKAWQDEPRQLTRATRFGNISDEDEEADEVEDEVDQDLLEQEFAAEQADALERAPLLGNSDSVVRKRTVSAGQPAAPQPQPASQQQSNSPVTSRKPPKPAVAPQQPPAVDGVVTRRPSK